MSRGFGVRLGGSRNRNQTEVDGYFTISFFVRQPKKITIEKAFAYGQQRQLLSNMIINWV